MVAEQRYVSELWMVVATLQRKSCKILYIDFYYIVRDFKDQNEVISILAGKFFLTDTKTHS